MFTAAAWAALCLTLPHEHRIFCHLGCGRARSIMGSLVLLRQKTGPLCTSSARSCCSLVLNSSGPNDVGEDKCFPAYVQNITLHVHNLNIMQRFIKFYFPSSPRRTLQLSWAVHFFFFLSFFWYLLCKELRAHRQMSTQVCGDPAAGLNSCSGQSS